jgi:hypothetical protein
MPSSSIEVDFPAHRRITLARFSRNPRTSSHPRQPRGVHLGDFELRMRLQDACEASIGLVPDVETRTLCNPFGPIACPDGPVVRSIG